MRPGRRLFCTLAYSGPVGPYAPRQGYVIEALNAGHPRDVTTDRADITTEVLDKHYDLTTKEERMERQENYLLTCGRLFPPAKSGHLFFV